MADVSFDLAMSGGSGEKGRAPSAGRDNQNIESTNLRRRLGFFLVILSCLLYGSLLLVPMAPFSARGKVVLSSLLVISGEASFWIGGLILGR